MREIKLLIMDLHGVLVSLGGEKNDSYSIPRKVLEGLTDHPLPSGPIVLGSHDWITGLGKFGIKPTDRKKLHIISNRWFNIRKEIDRRFEWVPEIIPKIQKQKVILTDAGLPVIYYHLGRNWTRKNFEAIFTWDKVPALKPNPAGVLMILKKMGIEAKFALMISDSLPDFLAGAAAGVPSAMVGKEWGNGHYLTSIREFKDSPFLYRVLEKPIDLMDL